MLKRIIGTAGITLWAAIIVYVLTISVAADEKKQVPAVSDSNGLEKMSRDFVDLLAKGDFNKAVENFDEAMKAALPSEKLKEVWSSKIAQFGPFEKQLDARQEKIQIYDVIYITCKFQKDSLDAKVVYNSKKQISGLWFVPTQKK